MTFGVNHDRGIRMRNSNEPVRRYGDLRDNAHMTHAQALELLVREEVSASRVKETSFRPLTQHVSDEVLSSFKAQYVKNVPRDEDHDRCVDEDECTYYEADCEECMADAKCEAPVYARQKAAARLHTLLDKARIEADVAVSSHEREATLRNLRKVAAVAESFIAKQRACADADNVKSECDGEEATYRTDVAASAVKPLCDSENDVNTRKRVVHVQCGHAEWEPTRAEMNKIAELFSVASDIGGIVATRMGVEVSVFEV